MTVQDQLKNLSALLKNAAEMIDRTAEAIDSPELFPGEKHHKIGSLLLSLDVTLINNRKRFDQIRKILRVDTNQE